MTGDGPFRFVDGWELVAAHPFTFPAGFDGYVYEHLQRRRWGVIWTRRPLWGHFEIEHDLGRLAKGPRLVRERILEQYDAALESIR